MTAARNVGSKQELMHSGRSAMLTVSKSKYDA
jgi:hypothetical protein